ncbi:1-aminocyclopropane-1-carboxylate oxidase 1 [Magnolia sinica]|uniref:1-aminocyclopropane-1-carboxylate oxidase 1 n=1 Tax=Magnolia sinica TaxID=86752 RepID=UPI002658C04A|nr:1-aminocyclopropane-1-carboxylate oxidase 1 [Magnolia sinica]
MSEAFQTWHHYLSLSLSFLLSFLLPLSFISLPFLPSMATSPEPFPEKPPTFRAPPPSPIATASGRRSAVANDNELAEFLENSLRVPHLVLPDPLFPLEVSAGNPPEIDFRSLNSAGSESVMKLLDSVAGVGCFQLVNHGISGDLVGAVRAAAGGIFRISPEKKAMLSRSPEMVYGFEEEVSETMSEEFFWGSRDEKEREGLKALMEGVWPDGFSNFSQKTEILSKAIEMVAGKVVQILLENMENRSFHETLQREDDAIGPVLCLYKHGRKISSGQWVSSLKSDVIRMLIGRSDYSHALCMHLCDGCSDFHFYSKKGWMSFCPNKEAIVVTVGDQIQAWSDGLYKHVIGRPIFQMQDEDSISMAFLYSPPSMVLVQSPSSPSCRDKSISLGQQVIVAICLTLLYHFLFYISKGASH